MLDKKRIREMSDSIRTLAKSKDYVGEIISEKKLKNGLRVIEKRTGFGVVGVIYESRPNVTSDVCSICFKCSSSVILKGGKEALNTNRAIVKLLNDICPINDVFQLIDTKDRKAVDKMLCTEGIDVIIPRGGEGLIKYVRKNSQVPIIETGTGNCHIFIDRTAEKEKAIKIVINAKTQRPSVCNAVETILVHKDSRILEEMHKRLKSYGVEIRGCAKTRKIIDCRPAEKNDWKREFLDLIIAIKIVDDVDEAIEHINRYGSHHSESIISMNKMNIKKFFKEIDSAVVYSNASTRFTDGGEFGLGAEIGISTQKLHARGPMGLKAMTTTKYCVEGSGQVRS